MSVFPLVSIIIPVFNRQAFVVDALDSVLAQHHRPLEIVVVDDGSVDSTVEAVERWIDLHKTELGCEPIVIQQESAGACSARNRGIRACHGKYVQFLDSDDILLPEKVSSAVGIMEANLEVDFVCCDMEVIEQNGNRSFFKAADLEACPTPAELALNFSQTMVPLFRKRLVLDAGFWDEDLMALQDWEYYARVLVKTRRVSHVCNVQCLMREHSGARISQGSPSLKRQLSLECSRLRAIFSVMKSVMETGGDTNAERRLSRLFISATLAVARLSTPKMARSQFVDLEAFVPTSKYFSRSVFFLKIVTSMPSWIINPALHGLHNSRQFLGFIKN